MNIPKFIDCIFVKIIHKKKALLKVAFWKRGYTCLMACLSRCPEIDIESKWVYSHIKLSYDLEQNVTEVRTQFDMAVNPL